MFMQVDKSLERAQGGLGIGLSLVKRLVEMHGGLVEAHSKGPGMGSEFVVRLPAAKIAATAERAGLGEHDTPDTSLGRRILVVDDNVDAAMSLAVLLGLMGHETRTAHDGLEAMAVADQFKPDVALLDIGMPKLNGFFSSRPNGRWWRYCMGSIW